jgi:hypothetical protein
MTSLRPIPFATRTKRAFEGASYGVALDPIVPLDESIRDGIATGHFSSHHYLSRSTVPGLLGPDQDQLDHPVVGLLGLIV